MAGPIGRTRQLRRRGPLLPRRATAGYWPHAVGTACRNGALDYFQREWYSHFVGRMKMY